MKEGIRLFLVRHGNTFETEQVPFLVGKTDLSLTAKGLSQAKTLGTYFKEHQIAIDRIHTGTLIRQKQTADTIARELLATEYHMHTFLNEIDYGLWEGKTVDVVQAEWPEDYLDWNERGVWPDKIFPEASNKRIKALSDWLKVLESESAPNANHVIVTSQGIIRLFLSLLPDVWSMVVQNSGCSSYKVKTGSLCELVLKDRTLKIAQWNVTPESVLET